MTTTIDTATTTTATVCCYEGCDHTASEYDSDGDIACPLHAAQSSRYDVVTDLEAGRWCDRAVADRTERLLRLDGWSVTIRNPRGGEAEGTYRRDTNGLQILGFSIPVPDALREAIDAAWNRAVTQS